MCRAVYRAPRPGCRRSAPGQSRQGKAGPDDGPRPVSSKSRLKFRTCSGSRRQGPIAPLWNPSSELCSDYADPPSSLLSPPCTFRQQSLPRPEKRPNTRAPSKPAGLQVQTKRADACHVPCRRDQTTTGHDQTFRNLKQFSLADGSSTPPQTWTRQHAGLSLRQDGTLRGRAAAPPLIPADAVSDCAIVLPTTFRLEGSDDCFHRTPLSSSRCSAARRWRGRSWRGRSSPSGYDGSACL